MKIFLVLSILFFVSFTSLGYGGERFIPLELFTGAEIRSDNEIKFTKANLVFGDKTKFLQNCIYENIDNFFCSSFMLFAKKLITFTNFVQR